MSLSSVEAECGKTVDVEGRLEGQGVRMKERGWMMSRDESRRPPWQFGDKSWEVLSFHRLV